MRGQNGRVPATQYSVREPPGTERPRRFRPTLRYELIGCGLHGHELLGTDVREVRLQDELVLRQDDNGLRWHRCLRCDSWLPLLPPANPARDHLPPLDKIDLPLRGKALRDKYVLRLIAIDRLGHFVLLALLAVAVLVFAEDQAVVDQYWFRVLHGLQTGIGGPSIDTTTGVMGQLTKLVTTQSTSVLLTGLGLAAYALLEGTEAVGLWRGRRWAEYLTLVATGTLLVPELLELAKSVTVLKMITLIINLAVMIYLLFAKRLFGIRGGGRAEKLERERDSGWAALQRTLPNLSGIGAGGTPAGPASSGAAGGPRT